MLIYMIAQMLNQETTEQDVHSVIIVFCCCVVLKVVPFPTGSWTSFPESWSKLGAGQTLQYRTSENQEG